MRYSCRLIIGFAILVAAGTAVAQRDFRNAFILNPAGDTIRGEADFGNAINHFKLCRFRLHDVVSEYGPDDLSGYGFTNDRFFVSRVLEANGARVFAELIVRGEVSLYRYGDDFFLEKGTEFVMLTNPTVRTSTNGNEVVRRSGKYKGIANMMMGTCPDVRKEIGRLSLNERSLTEVVEHYNQCKGVAWESYKGRKPWLKPQWGFEGGLSSSRIVVTTPSFGSGYMTGPYSNSNTWIAGITVDFLSPRINESMSIRTGVSFTHPKYYGYNQYWSGSTLNTNYVTLDVSQLKIPVGVSWRILAGKYRPYLVGGLMNTIRIDSYTQWVNEAETNGVLEVTEQDAASVNGYQIGYWAGLGVLREVSGSMDGFLEIRYEKLGELLENNFHFGPYNVEMISEVTYFQIVGGIRFK